MAFYLMGIRWRSDIENSLDIPMPRCIRGAVIVFLLTLQFPCRGPRQFLCFCKSCTSILFAIRYFASSTGCQDQNICMSSITGLPAIWLWVLDSHSDKRSLGPSWSGLTKTLSVCPVLFQFQPSFVCKEIFWFQLSQLYQIPSSACFASPFRMFWLSQPALSCQSSERFRLFGERIWIFASFSADPDSLQSESPNKGVLMYQSVFWGCGISAEPVYMHHQGFRYCHSLSPVRILILCSGFMKTDIWIPVICIYRQQYWTKWWRHISGIMNDMPGYHTVSILFLSSSFAPS